MTDKPAEPKKEESKTEEPKLAVPDAGRKQAKVEEISQEESTEGYGAFRGTVVLQPDHSADKDGYQGVDPVPGRSGDNERP